MRYPAYPQVDRSLETHEDGGMDLSLALRELFGKSTQTEIASRLAARGMNVEQTKVSRWLRGTLPDLADLPLMEEEFGRPKGWVLARAGLVDLPDVVSSPGIRTAEQDTAQRLAAVEATLARLSSQVAGAAGSVVQWLETLTASVEALEAELARRLPEPQRRPARKARTQ